MVDPRTDSYLLVNRANWDSRVEIHTRGYDLDRLRADPAAVSDVVAFDRPRLGDIVGLDVVHLQCHIGSDTVSLARLGAASVLGLDFSAPALEAAARLAVDCGVAAEWVRANVYDAVEALDGRTFDLVYTGVGALCWLPDVAEWARVVAALLRPGGRLFIRDGHPMLWALADPRDDGLVVVEYPYFERPDGVRFEQETTYVPHDEPLASPSILTWNHGIGEIIGAVTGAGLALTSFEEHRSVPWNPLGDAMVELPGGEWELRDDPDRLAATYTLQAVKPR